MEHIGIDVHKKESQICILAEGGELLDQSPYRPMSCTSCRCASRLAADGRRGE